MIPYGRQSIGEDDVAAVVSVLRGDWLTQGPAIEQFEAALVEVTGARFAVAVSSGTAALHAALAVARVDGSVVTSPLTFSASAAAALYVGARPAFVDIDPETLNLDPALVGSEHDALVAVHYAGLPVDLGRLRHRPRVVIEDAAHAIGASSAAGPVGSCTESDMCTFSFHPVKAFTTGEGGAVTTNDPELADRLRRFRSHGIVARPDLGGWAYEISSLGYNYRLTDIHAALGLSQIRKLDAFVARRNELAVSYRNMLAELPVLLPPAAPEGWRHAYHLFPVQVSNRRQVYDYLRANGVGVQVHYVPLHHQPIYAPYAGALPEADRVYAGLLSLPLHPALTDDEQAYIVGQLAAALDVTGGSP